MRTKQDIIRHGERPHMETGQGKPIGGEGKVPRAAKIHQFLMLGDVQEEQAKSNTIHARRPHVDPG